MGNNEGACEFCGYYHPAIFDCKPLLTGNVMIGERPWHDHYGLSKKVSFTKLGYLDIKSLPKDITSSQLEQILGTRLEDLKRLINDKKHELSTLKHLLENCEYEQRMAWTLFDKEGQRKHPD